MVDLIDQRRQRLAREHLATCRTCQQRLLDYACLDALMRRVFSVEWPMG